MPVSHTTTRVLHMVLPMATVHTHMVRWSARVPIVERFLGVFLGVLRRFYHAGAPNTPKFAEKGPGKPSKGAQVPPRAHTGGLGTHLGHPDSRGGSGGVVSL